jgi:4-diphosphocytidyl-2-C-methyl-D-erythritol kinase
VITLHARAKINLDLRILGRRADGYHELRTVLQTLALHDTLVFEARPRGFELAGDPRHMPLDRTNLAWRAADALWRQARRRGPSPGARVTIRKRIPARAGLGGGSSDAAATLAGLNRLWRLGLDVRELMTVAARLGSDVPFFLMGGSALGLGRGEWLYPLIDPPRAEVVLVVPPFGVATSEAYEWYRQDLARPAVDARNGSTGNDLEAPVAARHPEIGLAKRRLHRAGAAMAQMSGSGSAVFGLFSDVPTADAAARRLVHPGWTVIRTRTSARPAATRRLIAEQSTWRT